MQEWDFVSAEATLEKALRARSLRGPVELVHFTKAAVFLLPDEDLVAKVSRPGASPESARAGLEMAAWLYDQGFPVPRPALEVTPGPLRIDGSVVHFWERRGFSGRSTAPELGQLLRDFHEISKDFPGSLPALDPFSDIEEYLRILRLSEEDSRTLRTWAVHLQKRWQDSGQLGSGPLHGNAHRGNALLSGEVPYLLDWDLVSSGPREWDLLPETLGPRRYGKESTEYYLFARAYGYDVLRWSGFVDVVLVRELLATLFRLLLDQRTSSSGEGQRRMAFWRGQANLPLWRGF